MIKESYRRTVVAAALMLFVCFQFSIDVKAERLSLSGLKGQLDELEQRVTDCEQGTDGACPGSPGPAGPEGPRGVQGLPGQDGEPGADPEARAAVCQLYQTMGLALPNFCESREACSSGQQGDYRCIDQTLVEQCSSEPHEWTPVRDCSETGQLCDIGFNGFLHGCADACVADEFEPNESVQTAFDLGSLSDTAGGGGGNHDGATGPFCNGDTSFMWYTVPPDPIPIPLDVSDDTTVFYVFVSRRPGGVNSCDPYTLEISNGPVGAQEQITVTGNIGPGDVDWYRFDAIDVREGIDAVESFRVEVNLSGQNGEFQLGIREGGLFPQDNPCVTLGWP